MEALSMKYQWNQTNYHNFHLFEENKLPARAYFIPYQNEEETKNVSLTEYRYRSSLVRCLNGMWDFKFYENPNDVPEVIDTEKISFDQIDVPSCVQMRGYGRPFYTNIKYQFPAKPPRIPTLKPVGLYGGINLSDPTYLHYEIHRVKDEYNFVCVYRRKLEIKEMKKDYTISFLGVASCLDLYVNGQYVGYSEGSHNTAEFYLNPYLKQGENELLCIVHRWCTGTYLEDQDMFRHTGIFRDVLLREENPCKIWDYHFDTKKVGSDYDVKLDISMQHPEGSVVKVSLQGHDYEIEEKQDGKEHLSFSMHVPSPMEWNAENPAQYQLKITVYKDDQPISYITKKVGFRHIEIKKDLFYLNDQLIKIKGVNHHDTDEKNGYTMTAEQYEKDVLLCKQYGVNGIRTSHYPPDPILIELCNLYGIYVIAEADIETHGMGTFTSKSGRISNKPKWKEHFLDRGHRLYHPFKNDVCVTMWSLGNEAGGVYCQNAMYDFFRSISDIPVHFESAIHKKRVHYDVTSMMYPSIPLIHQVGSKTLSPSKKHQKMMEVPFFMCEYAHAMGVGPGCLEDYYEEVYRYDSLMGGCIWEMVDHAIYHDKEKHPDAPYQYTYGGDHGEFFHDGNFCCDGLFYPDRTPSTGAKTMKYVYRPLRFVYRSGGVVEIENTNRFVNASQYEIEFAVQQNGEVIRKDKIEVEIAPKEKKTVTLKDIPEEKDTFLLFTVTEKFGVRASFQQQVAVHESLKNLPVPQVEQKEDQWKVEEDKKEIRIMSSDFHIAFSKKNGTLSRYVYLGKEIILNAKHSITRVATDNDRYEKIAWILYGYCKEKERLKAISVKKQEDKILVCSKTKVGARLAKFIVEDTYEISRNGEIHVTSNIRKKLKIADLPRFGVIYELNKEYQHLSYYARAGESYIDVRNHEPIQLMEKEVKDMMEPNIRPQESGNRTDCRFLTVHNQDVGVTFLAQEEPFEFAAKDVKEKYLYYARHREDIEKGRENTYITIAKFNMGVGTGICGPVALPKYRFPSNRKYSYQYTILPYSKK